MKKRGGRRTIVDALPHLLGIGILAVLLLPQISYQAYHWVARGLLCGLLTFLMLKTRSLRSVLCFLVLCALFAWQCYIEEGYRTVCIAVAGFALAIFIRHNTQGIYWRIGLGVTVVSLLLAMSTGAMMLFRGEGEFLAAMRVGLIQEFPVWIACLVGGTIGGRIAQRVGK